MINFEGLLTFYLTFLFLVLNLKKMLNDSVLGRSDGAFWDSLGEKYLDILSNLGSKLLRLRVGRKLKTLETYTTPDDVKRHIENEMHNLCPHFHKLVLGTVIDRPGPTSK